MEQTLKSIYHTAKNKFKLNLIAGEQGLDTIITWVHLIEDASTTDFIRGNEIIITTGFRSDGEQWLKDFIHDIIERNSKGLIINTGVYIPQVPQGIVDYCERHNFPLFIMPWEIHLEDIMQHIIFQIAQSERQDVDEQEIFIKAMTKTTDHHVIEYFEKIAYDKHTNYCISLIEPVFKIPQEDIGRSLQNIIIDLRNMLYRYHARFHIIGIRESIAVIYHNTESKDIRGFSERLIRLIKKNNPKISVQMSVGPIVSSVYELNTSYIRSQKALRIHFSDNLGISFYEDLGIEALLFEIDDLSLLKDFRNKMLADLLHLDIQDQTQLLDVLRLYLKYNNSIKAVADESYTHRNTINYRMNKIRHLLSYDLDNPEYRLKLQIAFYIHDYLLSMKS